MATPSRRAWLPGAFVVLVIVLALALQLLGDEGTRLPASVGSAGEPGRLAAFRALDRLGLAPERWTKAPGALPRGEHLLIVPAAPQPPAGEWVVEADLDPDSDMDPAPGSEEAPVLDPLLGGAHDPGHYARFVEQGGTLLVPLAGVAGDDVDPEVLAFLSECLELRGADELRIEPGTERDRAELRLWSGERLSVEGPAVAAFGDLPASHPAETLVEREDGRAAALVLEVGRGQVVVVPTLSFVDNGRLGADDHGLYLVRLSEELGRGGRLLCDEYALGVYTPDSATGLALSGSLRGITLHLLALLLFLVWRQAWVREFPRDPQAYDQVSPEARVRARAGLLLRAGRHDLLDALVRRGVLHRILDRLKLSRSRRDRAHPPTLEALTSEEAGGWSAFATAELERIVALRDAARTDTLARALTGPLARSASELARNEGALRELERAVVAAGSAPQRKRT